MIRRWLIGSSAAALAALFLFPALYLLGILELTVTVWGINLGTLAWFLTAPFWMRRDR